MTDIKISLPQPQAPWESLWLEGRLDHLKFRDVDGDSAIDVTSGEAQVDRIEGGTSALSALVGRGQGPVTLDGIQSLAPKLSAGERFDRGVSAGPEGRIGEKVGHTQRWVRGIAARTQGMLDALRDAESAAQKAELARELRLAAPGVASQFADPADTQRTVGNSERELFAQISGLSQASQALMGHPEFAHAGLDDLRELRDLLPTVTQVFQYLEGKTWTTSDPRGVGSTNDALEHLARDVAPFFDVELPLYQLLESPGAHPNEVKVSFSRARDGAHHTR